MESASRKHAMRVDQFRKSHEKLSLKGAHASCAFEKRLAMIIESFEGKMNEAERKSLNCAISAKKVIDGLEIRRDFIFPKNLLERIEAGELYRVLSSLNDDSDDDDDHGSSHGGDDGNGDDGNGNQGTAEVNDNEQIASNGNVIDLTI